ncbi:MAG: M23 family metallopeptidase [Acetobacteraceae bacterium]
MPSRRWLVLLLLLPRPGHAEPPQKAAESLPSPVRSACISSPFGPRFLAGLPKASTFHGGIDMPAPAGEAVRAVAPGHVLRIQRKGPGGLEMLVQHDGFIGIYSHLGIIAPAFAEGKRTVATGEKLAVIGRSGVTYGTHLFFGMLVDGRPIDPAPRLGVPRCQAGRSPPRADLATQPPRTAGMANQ